MSEYIEFTAKTLDEAIGEACSFYDVPRGKLEIEIISGHKSGIFGIVGARKAHIRARKVQFESVIADQAPKEQASAETADKNRKNANVTQATEKGAAKHQNGKAKRSQEKKPRAATSAEQGAEHKQEIENAQGVPAPETRKAQETKPKATRNEPREKGERGSKKPARNGGRKLNAEREAAERQPKEPRPNRNQPKPRHDNHATTHERSSIHEEALPEIALESLDQELLKSTVLDAVNKLTAHIVGETEKNIELAENRVCVQIDCPEDSGLLIGRDGQTLAALQYLASCIVSRSLNASVRIQIDAGDYRERQEEKLRELALMLAQKVKATGRPQSTRPLSAFHRRVVHVALQDDKELQTHSKGDGPLKRIIIVPSRK